MCGSRRSRMPKYFHAISFAGVAGWGTGVLVFDTDSNLVVGADSGGVIYDGQFTVEHGRLTARVLATVPAGTALVTGVPPSNQPSTFTVNIRSEEHTSELQSPYDLVCRLLL